MNSAVYFFMNQLPRLPTENCRACGLYLAGSTSRYGNARQAACCFSKHPMPPVSLPGHRVPPRYEFGNAEF